MKHCMNDFIHFKDLIPQALKRYKLTREARAGMICEHARTLIPRIVGRQGDISKQVETRVRPKFFRGGILYVAVPSSVWAQRVYVERHTILEELNAHLDKAWVRDLRAVVE